MSKYCAKLVPPLTSTTLERVCPAPGLSSKKELSLVVWVQEAGPDAVSARELALPLAGLQHSREPSLVVWVQKSWPDGVNTGELVLMARWKDNRP